MSAAVLDRPKAKTSAAPAPTVKPLAEVRITDFRSTQYGLTINTDRYWPVFKLQSGLIVDREDACDPGDRVVVKYRAGGCELFELKLATSHSLIVAPVLGGDDLLLDRSAVEFVHKIVGTIAPSLVAALR